MIIGNTEVLGRIVDLYPEHRETIEAKTEIIGLGVDTAAFRPVARDARRESVARLGEHGPFAGKAPALSAELRERLDTGEFTAAGDYRDSYSLQ